MSTQRAIARGVFLRDVAVPRPSLERAYLFVCSTHSLEYEAALCSVEVRGGAITVLEGSRAFEAALDEARSALAVAPSAGDEASRFDALDEAVCAQAERWALATAEGLAERTRGALVRALAEASAAFRERPAWWIARRDALVRLHQPHGRVSLRACIELQTRGGER